MAGTSYYNSFNGSTQYLSTASNAAFAFGTGDFTVECWANPTTYNTYSWLLSIGGLNNAGGFGIFLDSVNSNRFTVRFGVSSDTYCAGTLSLNTWTHIAVVRQTGVIKIYFNGVLQTNVASASPTTSVTLNTPYIGSPAGGYFWTGGISNFRVVKGVAVYTGAFTVPNAPLNSTQSSGTNIAAITGTATSLLTCQSTTVVDNSTNIFPIINTGNITSLITQVITGGDASLYFYNDLSYNFNTKAYGAFFNGGNQSLATPSSSSFAFGTGDFTVEYYANPYSTLKQYIQSTYAFYYGGTTSAGYQAIRTTTGNANLALSTGDFTVECWVNLPNASSPIINGGGTGIILSTNASNNLVVSVAGNLTTTTGALSLNAWTHIAVVRQTGVIKIYFNGVLQTNASSTNPSASMSGTTLFFGCTSFTYPTGSVVGLLLSNIRIVKGTAVYTAGFTPIGPLTSISGTVLLTAQSSTFVDNGPYNIAISTYALANSPPSASAVSIPQTVISNNTGLDTRASNTSVNGFRDYFSITDMYYTLFWNNSIVFTSPIKTPPSQFSHIAVSRTAGLVNVFINGSSVGSFTNSTNFTDTNCKIGNTIDNVDYFYGYISNLRIVKGVGLYTANFALPNTPLPAVSGTSLLTAKSSVINDSSTNGFTITNNNTVTTNTTSNIPQFITITLAYTTVGAGTDTTPSNFASINTIEAIGGGGRGWLSGGGGGAYARSTSVLNLSPGSTFYYTVGDTNWTSGRGVANSWFNSYTNNPPISSSNGVLAVSGSYGNGTVATSIASGAIVGGGSGPGGLSSSCVGDFKYSGGTGISGGGGAAGPDSNGSNGGPMGLGGTSQPDGSGGGGGAGNGQGNGAMGAAAYSAGGNGGGTGGGRGGYINGVQSGGTTLYSGGDASSNSGAGGGGGSGYGTQIANGGNGGNSNTLVSTAGLAIGAGGGGGGCSTTNASSYGGSGGNYGGGGGMNVNTANINAYGGTGIVIFTYIPIIITPTTSYAPSTFF